MGAWSLCRKWLLVFLVLMSQLLDANNQRDSNQLQTVTTNWHKTTAKYTKYTIDSKLKPKSHKTMKEEGKKAQNNCKDTEEDIYWCTRTIHHVTIQYVWNISNLILVHVSGSEITALFIIASKRGGSKQTREFKAMEEVHHPFSCFFSPVSIRVWYQSGHSEAHSHFSQFNV